MWMKQLACILLCILYFSPVDVSGLFTAPPPICPGDTFIFRCTVTGDMNGITIWRVNRSSDCNLVHRIMSSSICGPSDVFTARSWTGFGTSGPSFSSTPSGTAILALNGTLVECFGPANNVDPGNSVGGSTLQILGQWSSVCCIPLWYMVSLRLFCIVSIHLIALGMRETTQQFLIEKVADWPEWCETEAFSTTSAVHIVRTGGCSLVVTQLWSTGGSGHAGTLGLVQLLVNTSFSPFSVFAT